jgi:O-antigen biosynthesis protein
MTAPSFSVVTATFDPEPEHLAACLESVEDQTFTGQVEHIVVDDGSRRADVRRVLDRLPVVAGRRIIRRSQNGGIVAASTEALATATGDFIVLLDHDDVLDSEALATVADHIAAHPDADVIYSDHDLLRPDGRLASPVYKPDFSLERLRNHNYITHLVVVRRSRLEAVGGFRAGTDGAQDHDLLLRLAEVAAPFHHVPRILLHWRQSPASVALDTSNKPDATKRQCAVVEAHLTRIGIQSSVVPGAYPGLVHIRRSLPASQPRVSVVIPTNGARGRVWGCERIFVHEAVRSLLAPGELGYDLEFVVVVDTGTDPLVERGLEAIAGTALRIVPYTKAFNFADKINVGVAASSGDFVLALNDDTELIEPGSVAAMIGLAQQPDVGLVGAKLLFEDGTLQHGGHVYNDMISHALLGWPGDHPGPHRLLAVERECSGVTAAAALLRRDVFDEVGGMSTDFAVNYNDVDFSLAVGAAGYRNLWTPHASWFHFEQQSGEHPIDPAEIALVQRRWGDALLDDPFYNSNLAPGRCDWLERPGRSGAPPYEIDDAGQLIWS